MPQLEKFVCISYSKIDFLIPNEDIFSAVSMKDFDVEQMCGPVTGIYNMDEIAAQFKEVPIDKNIRTMIMLKKANEGQLSFITASECKVCLINLDKFSLFSDIYSEGLSHFGILACSFEDGRFRYLLDLPKLVDYLYTAGSFEI